MLNVEAAEIVDQSGNSLFLLVRVNDTKLVEVVRIELVLSTYRHDSRGYNSLISVGVKVIVETQAAVLPGAVLGVAIHLGVHHSLYKI